MASDVIHQLVKGPFKIRVGHDEKTRCGIIACTETFGAFVVQMIDERGGKFMGTRNAGSVTCRKCINLVTVGNIHGRQPKPKRASASARRKALAA